VVAYDGKPSRSGGHAFALVGFNRTGFVIQNSWGDHWGAGGFAVVSYADWLAHAMDVWVAALGVPGRSGSRGGR
jgi:C1A family cysteine protease